MCARDMNILRQSLPEVALDALDGENVAALLPSSVHKHHMGRCQVCGGLRIEPAAYEAGPGFLGFKHLPALPTLLLAAALNQVFSHSSRQTPSNETSPGIAGVHIHICILTVVPNSKVFAMFKCQIFKKISLGATRCARDRGKYTAENSIWHQTGSGRTLGSRPRSQGAHPRQSPRRFLNESMCVRAIGLRWNTSSRWHQLKARQSGPIPAMDFRMTTTWRRIRG